MRPGRATRDIDFGIAVETWDTFQTLKARLVSTGLFAANTAAQQRLIYTDSVAGFSVPIDLIPFRGVSSANQMIEWPPGRDIVFNVAGFEDAWASSVLIAIGPDLAVRVASVPGLTLLKLIAWWDRRVENNKDAADLYRLLRTYADAGNVDRLYEHKLTLLESVDFDLELAGAKLLGGDVARICSTLTLAQARQVLTSPELLDHLIGQMVLTSSYAEAAPAITRLVSTFCQGFLECP